MDDEGLTANRQLIAGTRVCNLTPPNLRGRHLGEMRVSPKVDDRVGSPGDDAHLERIASGRRVGFIDADGGEGCSNRSGERRHQVRLPLISTRGRVQIGSGLDCTCSMTQRANCWSTACLA